MVEDGVERQRWDAILDRLPPGPVEGVEVGVWIGNLSSQLLRRNENLTLWLVDKGQQNHCINQTKFAGNRCKAVWLPSPEAAQWFDDKSMDFVFIDADHSYKAVKADIKAWWPKVKPGGYLCGHDYNKPPRKAMGVKQAVDELIPNAIIDVDGTWFLKCQ